MSIANGLNLLGMPNYSNLTELENNLIAHNINFQYIFQLPKSRWAATKKQMISVPVATETLINTFEQIPRLPKEAGLIEIELKRKKEYNRSHRREFINPDKLFRVLNHLKQNGHPHYQFNIDLETYEERCKNEDENGHNLIFGDDHDISDENNSDDENTEIEEEGTYTEEEEGSDDENLNKMDSIRQQQFDHNRNTCLTNNYPEIFLNENGENNLSKDRFSFAPAEGNYPTDPLHEEDWDIKSWPTFHPDGKYGLKYKRKVRLTDQQYFVQRILNVDKRFANSPSYIFAAAAYLEKKQLSRSANISYMRGRKSINNDGLHEYDLNDAFTIFDGIKNTPKYWQKVKYDMIAKLENIGPFHIFFTLSCGDKQWAENFSSFLMQNRYLIEYSSNRDGPPEIKIKSYQGRIINKPLTKFLEEDLDKSLHELIRTNVLTATRNFQHRVNSFRTHIMRGKNNPMKIKNMSYRVEFQGRGAAHIHGTLWLNIKEIEKLPLYRSKFRGREDQGSILSEAFKNLRSDTKLNDTEKEALRTFTDMFITCTLNSKKVGQRVANIAKEVNKHHCTKSCRKYETKCRFDFPKLPLKETLIIDKYEFTESKEKKRRKLWMK